MALSVNFTATQTVGAPSKIDFTDTSTGSDPDVVKRWVFIRIPNGSYLVEDGTTTDYEVWDGFPSVNTLTLDVLDKDYACTITVQWLKSDNTVLYEKILKFGFTLYNESFDYTLTQRLAGNPLLINDNSFYQNKSDLRTNIDSGNQAISLAGDTFAAQQCYDRATALRINSQYYFNGNPNT
jgi:hypothetical protein